MPGKNSLILATYHMMTIFNKKAIMKEILDDPVINKAGVATLIFPDLKDNAEKARKRLVGRLNGSGKFSAEEKEALRNKLQELLNKIESE
jgi:hypothetical protein